MVELQHVPSQSPGAPLVEGHAVRFYKIVSGERAEQTYLRVPLTDEFSLRCFRYTTELLYNDLIVAREHNHTDLSIRSIVVRYSSQLRRMERPVVNLGDLRTLRDCELPELRLAALEVPPPLPTSPSAVASVPTGATTSAAAADLRVPAAQRRSGTRLLDVSDDMTDGSLVSGPSTATLPAAGPSPAGLPPRPSRMGGRRGSTSAPMSALSPTGSAPVLLSPTGGLPPVTGASSSTRSADAGGSAAPVLPASSAVSLESRPPPRRDSSDQMSPSAQTPTPLVGGGSAGRADPRARAASLSSQRQRARVVKTMTIDSEAAVGGDASPREAGLRERVLTPTTRSFATLVLRELNAASPSDRALFFSGPTPPPPPRAAAADPPEPPPITEVGFRLALERAGAVPRVIAADGGR